MPSSVSIQEQQGQVTEVVAPWVRHRQHLQQSASLERRDDNAVCTGKSKMKMLLRKRNRVTPKCYLLRKGNLCRRFYAVAGTTGRERRRIFSARSSEAVAPKALRLSSSESAASSMNERSCSFDMRTLNSRCEAMLP